MSGAAALAVYLALVLALCVLVLRRPGAALIMASCMFALKQWAQASAGTFAAHQSLTNWIAGAIVLAGVATHLLRGSLRLFAYTREFWLIVLLYLSMRGRWRSRGQVATAVVIGSVVGAIVLAIAGGTMLHKVSLLSESSNFNRVYIWEASLRAAQASPWLGWGLGTFAEIFAAYQPDEIRQANDKAHSTPIELYVETGILGTVPGLLMVLIPWYVCLRGALQRRRHRANR